MPLTSTKSSGFFTFGAGVVVGLGVALALRTTLPRPTEMVGLIMQKLGFELGDILLALWDPEAQAALAEASTPAALPAPQKKKKSKTASRKSKASRLSVTPRTTSSARLSGKSSKLPLPRRVHPSRVIARLN